MKPGTTDPSDPSSYYGGAVKVNGTKPIPPFDYLDLPEGSTIHVKLVPVGRLMDGSLGTTKEYDVPFKRSAMYLKSIMDIPIGKYTLTADVKTPDGKAKPLRVVFGTVSAIETAAQAKVTTSATLEFPPGAQPVRPYLAASFNTPGLYFWP